MERPKRERRPRRRKEVRGRFTRVDRNTTERVGNRGEYYGTLKGSRGAPTVVTGGSRVRTSVAEISGEVTNKRSRGVFIIGAPIDWGGMILGPRPIHHLEECGTNRGNIGRVRCRKCRLILPGDLIGLDTMEC